MNANVVDYLTQIENLTNTNLQILKTLNDSFFTKKNHLFTEVNDTTYVIPSFLSLENKINMLQENFENLVKSPETGEAYFNFNGNTRSIEVRKYNHTPDPIKLNNVSKFGIDSNDIFKDFMTPVPYINLELPTLPNDIVTVNVKKVIPKNESLLTVFRNSLNGEASVSRPYSDIYKSLVNFTEDVDYVEYDTLYTLPIRKNIGTGTYVIESVIEDKIDENLNEIITLKLRSDLSPGSGFTSTLTYKMFDETIEKPLQVGDELINYDGTGKVEIIDVRTSTNTIVVRVVNGEYMNFVGTDSYTNLSYADIHDFSKLRFHHAVDYSADKYIKVPLEEDQHIFVAVSAVNNRMNIQGSWGTGLIINTHALTNSANDSFKDYYDSKVKNIGDVLYEMTSMMTDPITKLSESEFNNLIQYTPSLSNNCVSVLHINKHLNNSESIKNIRLAYDQKKNAELELTEVQTRISNINKQLAEISFEDTIGTREAYIVQLEKLNKRKGEIITSINNSINTISIAANSADVPIENAKYRIRGFYVPTIDNVIGIQVQYRYKNSSMEVGNAVSINGENGETYIYSDWNNLNTFNKNRIAKYENGKHVYDYEANNENENEPSYNQIDIPISQGETVDIRLRLVYSFGQPFINMTSRWSNTINVQFPTEYAKDVQILTIIEENNNDIETNRFKNILIDAGIDSHTSDKIIDNNNIYFHKPENISSGFYTPERRIIPLKDKILSMSNDIAELKSNVLGAEGNYKVSIVHGNDSAQLHSDRDNFISLAAYNDIAITKEGEVFSGVNGLYNISDGVISTTLNISIKNTGSTVLKLYSLFPGNRDVKLNSTSSSFVKKSNYCNGLNEGVWFKCQQGSENVKLQTQNQFITFRINDPWTGTKYYDINSGVSQNNLQNSKMIDNITNLSVVGMILYPSVNSEFGLCINSDNTRSYLAINPGEEILIPINCSYIVSKPNSYIQKTLSFDLRTSLYSDPINYTFTVTGKNSISINDKILLKDVNKYSGSLNDTMKYTTTVE
jgi:hypothetical protein